LEKIEEERERERVRVEEEQRKRQDKVQELQKKSEKGSVKCKGGERGERESKVVEEHKKR